MAPGPVPAPPASPLSFPNALLPTLLSVSLSAVNLLRPVYGPDGTAIVDFTLDYLNPAAQRMSGLPEQPGTTALARFPEIAATGVFGFYRRTYETGGPGDEKPPFGPEVRTLVASPNRFSERRTTASRKRHVPVPYFRRGQKDRPGAQSKKAKAGLPTVWVADAQRLAQPSASGTPLPTCSGACCRLGLGVALRARAASWGISLRMRFVFGITDLSAKSERGSHGQLNG